MFDITTTESNSDGDFSDQTEFISSMATCAHNNYRLNININNGTDSEITFSSNRFTPEEEEIAQTNRIRKFLDERKRWSEPTERPREKQPDGCDADRTEKRHVILKTHNCEKILRWNQIFKKDDF